MPNRQHLRRLDNVWVKNPLYFVTICDKERRPILSRPQIADRLIQSWHDAAEIHGWAIGRYIIMPDHVHFFCRNQSGSKPLQSFIRDWKKWTTRQIVAASVGLRSPLWQPEFFDHIIRSADSYSDKWAYVQANPVRAGFVGRAADWPYAGEIVPLAF